jgi:hypothetical protein
LITLGDLRLLPSNDFVLDPRNTALAKLDRSRKLAGADRFTDLAAFPAGVNFDLMYAQEAAKLSFGHCSEILLAGYDWLEVRFAGKGRR